MNLSIELITGNVNQVNELDFLLVGHKNPLREQICRETDSTFKVINSDNWFSPHQYKILEAPSYKWKKVAAIKFRSNGKLSGTQFAKISSPISTALKQPYIQSIGILPPTTWRNPSYCALGVIYSLWTIGCVATASRVRPRFPDLIDEIFPSPSNKTFKIISRTGTDDFEEILKNDFKVMWDFFDQLCERQKDNPLISQSELKRLRIIPVEFNFTKIKI
jgi:hypothetical protein